ncbi:hypothetical protein MANES_02G129300v8 [Manihot esculenta]|uniref:non-specific serine/threonine protein kinase n=2 Tax=Manihot esculenta TaxID=3983 RepID=A0A2C9WEW8_MANES|nr:hypothetical protein MANES_02G129300v8 [Manihot esculenta]
MPDFAGQGFAFTISPSAEFTGAWAIGYLGLFNLTNKGLSSNHVFAVELDTILTPEFNDINDNHVGIDVNGLISNVSAPVAYFPDKERENKSLELRSGNPRPLLSTAIDLSPVFMDSMYVGFSSSTGTLASYHYILGWSFNRSGPAQSLDVSKLPSLPPKRESSKKLDLRIMVPSVTASIVLIIASGVVYRRKRFEELHEDWEQEYGPQRFSYKDLYKATRGFKDKEQLGFGGFGSVYKGVLPSSNTQVAVKKVSHDSQQGIKEFVSEIVSMGRLRHRNLVQLLGYCRRKGELLLVYDYMPNGSLDKFLFQNDTPNLNWIRRYQILRGVASAMLYLHEEWEQVVLHRDVKASNVMLDAELNGRLGDFGLAKFYDHGSIPQTTCVVGTVGYLAPEVSRTGRVTTSSDVFAFGILMLEVACGRRPIEPERPPQEALLLDWVLECWKRGAILETSDPRLEGRYMAEEMEMILKLGLLCTHATPAARPITRQVMQYLDKNAPLPDILLDGPGIGLVTVSQEAAGDFYSSFPASNDYSVLSITTSILSYGR